MITLLAAMVLGNGQGEDPIAMIRWLTEPNNKPARLAINLSMKPLEPPKFSPKLFGEPAQKWQFDWMAASYGPDPDAKLDPETGKMTSRIRFRVYSQMKQDKDDKTPLVARQAIRMWDILTSRYKIGHSESINAGIIDYYLCFGGEAGGEFIRGADIISNKTIDVNTIYIYDIRSFKEPIEMAREVAHEYGHAVLPPVGGYLTPEYWANGYLGEKFLMRQIRDQFARNIYGTDDAMGATFPMLDTWVKKNVDPLVIKTAAQAPSATQLGDKGKVGMDSYCGLVLYADTIFPPNIVSRSMFLMGSQNAKDYPDALLRATQEMPKITLSIPPYLKGKPIWIPVGKGKVSQASIVKREGDWVQVLPQAGGVIITTAKDTGTNK